MNARVDILDYLRFIAAAGVVSYHYFFNGISVGKVNSIESFGAVSLPAKYGFLGVTLFFLISGFVIYQSALTKTAAQFAIGRIVRLFPMFWIAVCFTTLFSLLWDAETNTVSLAQFAVNLTMISRLFGVPFVDGVYWSLNYEIAFYGIVFCFILFRMSDKMNKIVMAWALFMFAYYFIDPILTWCEVAVLEGYFPAFVGGALLASVCRDGWTRGKVLACVMAYFLCVDFALDRLPELATKHRTDFSAAVVVGTLSSFFVAIGVLSIKRVAALRLPYAAALGGLTYPLYLIHARFGYLVLSRYAEESNKWLVVALLLIGVLVVSLVMVDIDKLTKKFWTTLLDSSVGAIIRRVERQKALA